MTSMVCHGAGARLHSNCLEPGSDLRKGQGDSSKDRDIKGNGIESDFFALSSQLD